MRKTLRLKVGDPIEFFAEHDGLILKKYSPISRLDSFGEEVLQTLTESINKTSMLVDGDNVVLAQGKYKANYENKKISFELEKLIEKREKIFLNINDGSNTIDLVSGENLETTAQLIVPIVAGGDLFGAVVVVAFGMNDSISESDVRTATFVSDLLKKQFE